MAQQVCAREANLRLQIQELRLQIDEVKRARDVAQITESDYFQQLQDKVRQMRGGSHTAR